MFCLIVLSNFTQKRSAKVCYFMIAEELYLGLKKQDFLNNVVLLCMQTPSNRHPSYQKKVVFPNEISILHILFQKNGQKHWYSNFYNQFD